MKSLVRVLHVIDSFGHGGAEQNLLTMLQELQSGFEHHLVSLYPDDRLRAQFERFVASATCLGVSRTTQLPAAIRSISRVIQDRRIDVVSSQLIRAQIVGRIAAAMQRVPSVVTWQNTSYAIGSLSEFGGSEARRFLTLAADRVTGLRDAAVIAVSKTVRDDNCRRLGIKPELVHVIPNAVSLERLAPIDEEMRQRVRASLGVAGDEVMLLSVGRLVAQKAHSDAIASIPAVLEAIPHARYFIAGEGPMRDELQRKKAALKLDDRVRLLGARSDVSALLQAADLFIFPSLFEGLPVALIEAISAGARCVASDIPQNREAAHECRHVVFAPTGQPPSLARSIIGALSEKVDTAQDREATKLLFGAPTVAVKLGTLLREVAGA